MPGGEGEVGLGHSGDLGGIVLSDATISGRARARQASR
jgi:hypothetical protein